MRTSPPPSPTPVTTSYTYATSTLASATDERVIAAAAAARRVLISADTDFGTLLARSHAPEPSFILIRRASGRAAIEQAQLIIDNLPAIEGDLKAGAIAVLGETSIRIRILNRHIPGPRPHS